MIEQENIEMQRQLKLYAEDPSIKLVMPIKENQEIRWIESHQKEPKEEPKEPKEPITTIAKTLIKPLTLEEN